ncbi:MAG: phospholipase D family protein [Spongiibacteraceae bacterium]|jgi:putative cardiolipin synthase|nr:phospholipase D family protein [Spongiibacteraceae bacterium]
MRSSGTKTVWMLALSASLSLMEGCGSLPSLEQRSQSSALSAAEAQQTTLGRAIAPRAHEHPGKSGIQALGNPLEAFAARALLADAAERTLDVQYYIWQDDITGTLMFQSLLDAAERGVRVRLLLDDMKTAGLDPLLLALDVHPNIEVRLFNPFLHRRFRALDFVTDFSRVNRRMHNKSFTADNQVSIVGGRNIADEYFGAGGHMIFADLDVLAVGPVVDAVSRDFDRYWASLSAYPIMAVLAGPEAADPSALTNASTQIKNSDEARIYLQALRDSRTIAALAQGHLAFEWAETRLISDDPAKGIGEAADDALLFSQLTPIISEAIISLQLVSAYLVPTRTGTQSLVELAHSGVDIQILTNSLEATDVVPVHAGYAKHRKALLKAGITLYEIRGSAALDNASKHAGPFGSSAASLHAKTFAADDERIFVGSFNFDPRSAKLNTEMGFIIESPELAKRIHLAFDRRAPRTAYQVKLSENGELYWLEDNSGTQIRYDTEPNTSIWKRMGVYILGKLPIDWLL